MKRRPRSESRLSRWLPAEGVTLMFVAGPSERTRRVHLPRWAIVAGLSAWLCALLAAGILGYASAAPQAERVDPAQGAMRVASTPSPRSIQE
jgi:hypothetical protein